MDGYLFYDFTLGGTDGLSLLICTEDIHRDLIFGQWSYHTALVGNKILKRKWRNIIIEIIMLLTQIFEHNYFHFLDSVPCFGIVLQHQEAGHC